MEAVATDTKRVMQEYFEALSGQQKTEALIDKYVSDPLLKAHILETDAGFPGYYIEVHDLVGDGDLIAVRGTVHGKHMGEYAGVAPTGKQIAIAAMIFYQVTEGRISKFWLQADMPALMEQIKG